MGDRSPSRASRSASSLPTAAALVERIAGGCDGVRFTDRTDGTHVPPEVDRVALVVLESWLAPVGRGDVPGHVATARARIVGEDLVLSVQTAARSKDTAPFVPDLDERARLRGLVEALGGRLLARATADGNRIVIAHLPLGTADPLAGASTN